MKRQHRPASGQTVYYVGRWQDVYVRDLALRCPITDRPPTGTLAAAASTPVADDGGAAIFKLGELARQMYLECVLQFILLSAGSRRHLNNLTAADENEQNGSDVRNNNEPASSVCR